MFDLDISKMALIGVVALVVLGPERLPRVARTAGALLGRAQRYINDVKSEVTREIEIEELRKAKSGFEDAAATVQSTIQNTVRNHSADLTNALNSTSAAPERTAEVGTDSATASTDSATLNVAENHWLPPKTRLESPRRRNWRGRRNAVPAWYKLASAKRTHVVSAAAREARALRQGETVAQGPGAYPATNRRARRFL